MAAGHSQESLAALDELCCGYWPPLYGYLRQRGLNEHDAKDLLQGFFARFLSRNDFGRADPSKGKFRSYLVGALENFLVSDARERGALMRGGGRIHVSIDSTDAERLCSSGVAPDVSAEERFDRQWVETLLSRALDKLSAEQAGAGQKESFDRLLPWLTTPPDSGTYQTIAAELGKSPAAIAMIMKRLRQRFRELVRAEVRDTCRTPHDFEEEWSSLMAAL